MPLDWRIAQQPLAWAILTALVGGGVFLGLHVGRLTTVAEALITVAAMATVVRRMA